MYSRCIQDSFKIITGFFRVYCITLFYLLSTLLPLSALKICLSLAIIVRSFSSLLRFFKTLPGFPDDIIVNLSIWLPSLTPLLNSSSSPFPCILVDCFRCRLIAMIAIFQQMIRFLCDFNCNTRIKKTFVKIPSNKLEREWPQMLSQCHNCYEIETSQVLRIIEAKIRLPMTSHPMPCD